MYRISLLMTAALIILAAKPSAAEWKLAEQDLRVSLYYESTFLMGGRAGRFDINSTMMEPDLRNIYGPGVGGRVELGWRFEPDVEAIAGIGYIKYEGGLDRLGTAGGDRVTIVLEDYEVIPIYIGLKYLFSDDPSGGLVPYARADVGYIITSDVNAIYQVQFADLTKQPINVETRWWDGTALFVWDIGGGLEYRRGNLGFFGEMLYQSYGKPDRGHSAIFRSVVVSSAGTGWAPLALRGGIAYYF